jgi:hypothetical protein
MGSEGGLNRREFLRKTPLAVGAAIGSISAVTSALAQEANLDRESKIPSAEEVERIVRAALAGLASKDAPLSAADALEKELRLKAFGNQDESAGVDAFRASGLRFEGEVVPLFQAANDALSHYHFKFSGFPEFVLAEMRTEQVQKLWGPSYVRKDNVGVKKAAEDIHNCAIELARANEQLLAKIKSLAAVQK